MLITLPNVSAYNIVYCTLLTE